MFQQKGIPNELIPQITKIYVHTISPPIEYNQYYRLKKREEKKDPPSIAVVNKGNVILVLGLFASNTPPLINASLALRPSSLTSSSVLPNASASGCATKLDRSILRCFECLIGLCEVAGAIKSEVGTLVHE